MSLTKEQESTLKDMATKLRIHSVEMTSAAKSGHPTSCASMAETMAVLFYHTMRYDDDISFFSRKSGKFFVE